MCDYSLHNVKSRPAKVGEKRKIRLFISARADSLHRKISIQQSAFFPEPSLHSRPR
jgi:hypothetical protein